VVHLAAGGIPRKCMCACLNVGRLLHNPIEKGLRNHEEHEGHEEKPKGCFSGEAAFMLFMSFMVEMPFGSPAWGQIFEKLHKLPAFKVAPLAAGGPSRKFTCACLNIDRLLHRPTEKGLRNHEEPEGL